MTHFAIIGRLHGDDEDTCFVYECDDEPQARQNFIDDMLALDDITPEEAAEGFEHTNVYITHTLASESRIEVL